MRFWMPVPCYRSLAKKGNWAGVLRALIKMTVGEVIQTISSGGSHGAPDERCSPVITGPKNPGRSSQVQALLVSPFASAAFSSRTVVVAQLPRCSQATGS